MPQVHQNSGYTGSKGLEQSGKCLNDNSISTCLGQRFKLVTLYKYNAPVRHYLNVRKFPSFTFVSIPAVKYILGCNIVCWMHGKFVATECRRQFLLRLCFVCSAGAFLPPIHIDISTSMAVVTNLTFYGYSLTGLESLHYFLHQSWL